MEEDLIQDILSHGVDTGVPRDTLRRKALYACDEITGLVTAVALVRPRVRCWIWKSNRSRRNGKTKPSPPGPTATKLQSQTAEFGVELWEHVGNVILAMRKIAPELGLVGNVG